MKLLFAADTPKYYLFYQDANIELA